VSVAALAETLATTPLERLFLDRLRDASGEADGVMERHGARCFLLVERLADRRGVAIDREVALCAALVHDIGIYPSLSRGGVYTVESGEFAANLFTEAGAEPERARLCADACAFHHARRSQWQRGAEVELLRLADRVEVSGGLARAGLTRDDVAEVFASASRRGFYSSIGLLALRALRDRPRTMLRIFDPARDAEP
jgi:hypothetical protein